MSGPDIIWCTKVSFHCRKVPELGQTDESPEDSTRHAEINKQLLKISRLNLLLPLLCSARFYGLWPNSCPALKIPPRTQDIRLKCRHIAPKARADPRKRWRTMTEGISYGKKLYRKTLPHFLLTKGPTFAFLSERHHFRFNDLFAQPRSIFK